MLEYFRTIRCAGHSFSCFDQIHSTTDVKTDVKHSSWTNRCIDDMKDGILGYTQHVLHDIYGNIL